MADDAPIGGEPTTRPEAAGANVWARDETIGEIVLRDTDGAEHARFAGPGAVVSDADPYHDGGENAVKRPVITTMYDLDGEPDLAVLTVPADRPALAELSLVEDAAGTTTPADEIWPNGDSLPAELGDWPRALLALFRERWDDSTASA